MEEGQTLVSRMTESRDSLVECRFRERDLTSATTKMVKMTI